MQKTGIVLEPLDHSSWIMTLVGIGVVGNIAFNRCRRQDEDQHIIDAFDAFCTT